MAHREWGILIVNYLFLGGVSAGLFFISALASYFHDKEEPAFERIARYGAMIAPWPVAMGSLLLVFDLGNWLRFYKLFVHFRWQSPMSIGSWLLLAFNGVAVLYFWTWLPENVRAAIARRAAPVSLNYNIARWRRVLAALGLPLSISVGIYTGVLLGAVQARPFWNTNLVAQIFLFSALSTGCAVLIVALSANRKTLDPGQLKFLYTLDICAILLELFVVLPYIIHGELSVQAVRDSLALILGGPYTLTFWVLFMVLGLLTPLGLEIREMIPAVLAGRELHHDRRLGIFTGALIIFGGYVLRYVFVYAGQVSAFR